MYSKYREQDLKTPPVLKGLQIPEGSVYRGFTCRSMHTSPVHCANHA